MLNADVNIWAVLAAGVSAMVVGFIWYGPLFSKTWLKLVGKTEEQVRKGATQAYILSFAVALITAYILAHIVDYAGATTAMDAIVTAFWVWLGFVATSKALDVVYEGKNTQLYAINVGYHLLEFIVMALILVLWV